MCNCQCHYIQFLMICHLARLNHINTKDWFSDPFKWRTTMWELQLVETTNLLSFPRSKYTAKFARTCPCKQRRNCTSCGPLLVGRCRNIASDWGQRRLHWQSQLPDLLSHPSEGSGTWHRSCCRTWSRRKLPSRKGYEGVWLIASLPRWTTPALADSEVRWQWWKLSHSDVNSTYCQMEGSLAWNGRDAFCEFAVRGDWAMYRRSSRQQD